MRNLTWVLVCGLLLVCGDDNSNGPDDVLEGQWILQQATVTSPTGTEVLAPPVISGTASFENGRVTATITAPTLGTVASQGDYVLDGNTVTITWDDDRPAVTGTLAEEALTFTVIEVQDLSTVVGVFARS